MWGVLLLIAGGWCLSIVSDQRALPWVGMTVASVICGFVALGWLRAARVGLTSPQVMLLLGTLGMVGGLWLDARAGGFLTLTSLCLAGSGDFSSTVK